MFIILLIIILYFININLKENFSITQDQTALQLNNSCYNGDLNIDTQIGPIIDQYMIQNNIDIQRSSQYSSNSDFVSDICHKEDLNLNRMKCAEDHNGNNDPESCKILDFCEKITRNLPCGIGVLNTNTSSNVYNNYHINNLNIENIISDNNIKNCDDQTLTGTDPCYKTISSIDNIGDCMESCDYTHDCISSYLYNAECKQFLQNTPDSTFRYNFDYGTSNPNSALSHITNSDNQYFIKNSYLNQTGGILPNFSLENLKIKYNNYTDGGITTEIILYDFNDIDDSVIHIDYSKPNPPEVQYYPTLIIQLVHPGVDYTNTNIKYRFQAGNSNVFNDGVQVLSSNEFSINTILNTYETINIYIQVYLDNQIFFTTLKVNLI